MEYAALLYVPKEAPRDLYYSDFQTNIRLYIQRVFITDDYKVLIPTYLRFVRGVIDSEDLPLNVSREILQENTLLVKIQNALVKKFLNKCGELAGAQPQLYLNFIKEYNRPLKEGLYQDFANREQLLELVRFHSTASGEFTSLSEYVARAREAQKYIYYLSGNELARLRSSPLLEHYKKQDVEVLLLDDEIDELVVPMIGAYKEKQFRPINKRFDEGDDLVSEAHDKKLEQRLAPLRERIAHALKDRVAKVEFSARLDTSPVCVIFPDGTPSLRMKEMLKAIGGEGLPDEKPILEINPSHAIIQSLESVEEGELFDDLCMILLEQSLLVENVPFENSHAFVERINRIVERAVGGGAKQEVGAGNGTQETGAADGVKEDAGAADGAKQGAAGKKSEGAKGGASDSVKQGVDGKKSGSEKQEMGAADGAEQGAAGKRSAGVS